MDSFIYNDKKKVIKIEYLVNGTLAFDPYYMVSGIKIKYTEDTVSRSFFEFSSKSYNNRGVHKEVIEYDNKTGFPIKVTNYDTKDKIIFDKSGSSVTLWVNDSKGRRVKSEYVYDNQALGDDKLLDVSRVFDNNDRIETKTLHYNKKLNSKGKITYKYDRWGNTMQIRYFNSKGDQISSSNIKKHDKYGNVIRIETSNDTCRLFDGTDISIVEYTYNKFFNKIEEKYFDKYNNEEKDEDNVSLYKYEYNEFGSVNKISYFTHDDRLISNKNGVSVIKRFFKKESEKDNNLLSDENYYDIHGNILIKDSKYITEEAKDWAGYYNYHGHGNIFYLNMSIRLNPFYYDTYSRRASVYIEKGELLKAEKDLMNAADHISEIKDKLNLFITLADFMYDKQEYSKALKYLSQIIEIETNNLPDDNYSFAYTVLSQSFR